MNRLWLMSSVSLPAPMPYLCPVGKLAVADLMVHRWVCAELKRVRENARQAAVLAKLEAPKAA